MADHKTEMQTLAEILSLVREAANFHAATVAAVEKLASAVDTTNEMILRLYKAAHQDDAALGRG